MKEIKLTQGKVALVNDEDYEWLNQWKWTAHKSRYVFYADRRLGRNKHVKMHRLIMEITDSSILIDHKDGNGLNNQRNNLRIATHGQNMANTSSYRNSISKYLGVSFDKNYNKWRARIQKDKKPINIGNFKTEDEAALAYNRVAIEIHGEFANLNKVSCGI